jgi:hypothetical protein
MNPELKSKIMNGIIALLLIFTAFNCNVEKIETPKFENGMVTITFKSYYEPISPLFAKIYFWEGLVINGIYMSSTGQKFSYEIPVQPNTNYLFNIETNVVAACEMSDNEWVAFKNGIRADYIKIEDKILDGTFLFDNNQGGSNFIFRINQNGEIIPGHGKQISINESIPPEIWFIEETVHFYGASITNQYANAWYSVIHDKRKGGESRVEIDYLKLFARLSNGQDMLLAYDDFNSTWDGGLYIRYPYYECSLDERFQWDMPAEIENGRLVFIPSDIPNRAWHGWCTGPWSNIPNQTIDLWVETKVKISGNALMQIGIDFKPSQHSNHNWTEFGVSDWIHSSNEFQTVYFNQQL